MQNKIETKGNFALTVISEEDYLYVPGLAMLRARLRKSAMSKALSLLVTSFDTESETFVLADEDGVPNETDDLLREVLHIVRVCTPESEKAEEFKAQVISSRGFLEESTVVKGGTKSLKARLSQPSPSLDKAHQRKALENQQWQMAGDDAVTHIIERVENDVLDIAEEPEYVGTYIRRSIDKILDDATAKIDKRFEDETDEWQNKAVMGLDYLASIKKAYC